MRKRKYGQVELGYWKYELAGEGNASLRMHRDNILNSLDRLTEEANLKLQAREYGEILVDCYVKSGYSDFAAREKMRNERSMDLSVFTMRAIDLFAYRKRITTGEGAISTEIFNNSLEAQPMVVLAHAARWSAVQIRLVEAHQTAVV